jgi:hypothetical protein
MKEIAILLAKMKVIRSPLASEQLGAARQAQPLEQQSAARSALWSAL